jgi:hypothetical protein
LRRDERDAGIAASIKTILGNERAAARERDAGN